MAMAGVCIVSPKRMCQKSAKRSDNFESPYVHPKMFDKHKYIYQSMLRLLHVPDRSMRSNHRKRRRVDHQNQKLLCDGIFRVVGSIRVNMVLISQLDMV